jgi:hypothetical protein
MILIKNRDMIKVFGLLTNGYESSDLAISSEVKGIKGKFFINNKGDL